MRVMNSVQKYQAFEMIKYEATKDIDLEEKEMEYEEHQYITKLQACLLAWREQTLISVKAKFLTKRINER